MMAAHRSPVRAPALSPSKKQRSTWQPTLETPNRFWECEVVVRSTRFTITPRL